MIGSWEILLILLVVLVLFGGKKLPEFARSLGKGIQEFKKASREISEEIGVSDKATKAEDKSEDKPTP